MIENKKSIEKIADKEKVIEKPIEVKEVKIPNTKTENCKVLKYDNISKELDVEFKGFGIKIENINTNITSEFVKIEYTSDIGKADFTFKLKV